MEFIKAKLKELFYLLKDEFIPEQKKRLKIFIYCPRMFIWIGIVMLIGHMFLFGGYYSTLMGIPLLIPNMTITFILLLVSLSNVAEWIFQKIEDIRHVATDKEKEYLLPIYNHVYNTYKAKCHNLSHKVRLYIVDTMKVESFAIGRKTIALSQGMIETMSEEELKDVIAHEFSHIVLYHSQIRLIIAMTANIQLWICIVIEKILMRIIATMKSDNIIAILLKFVHVIFATIVNIVMFIANMIIIPNYRNSEFKADNLTVKCGFGLELKNALYKIYDMEISDKKELLNRIYDTHPRTAYRIEKIENTLN